MSLWPAHSVSTLVCARHLFIFAISYPVNHHIATDSHKKTRKQNKTRIVCCHAHSLRCDEGVLFDGGQDIRKLNFGCEGVPMVDDWHSFRAIPAVHWKKKNRHMHATSFHLLSFKDKENKQTCEWRDNCRIFMFQGKQDRFLFF